MGTDLFKQGTDVGEHSSNSTVPVVEDPTGSLSLSRTVTPVATGPKVLPIPDPDPELLALFAPQADGDFDADGLGDTAVAVPPSSSGSNDAIAAIDGDEDWQALLDDSIPVRSLAKASPPPDPALTAELTVQQRGKKRALQKNRLGSLASSSKAAAARLATAASKATKPTAARSGLDASASAAAATSAAPFARSADAFAADPPAGAPSPEKAQGTGPVVKIVGEAETKTPPVDTTDTATGSDEADVAQALLQTLGKKPTGPAAVPDKAVPDNAATDDAATDNAATKNAVVSKALPEKAAPEKTGEDSATGEALASKPATDEPTVGPRPILAAAATTSSDPVEQRVDAEVDPYQPVKKGSSRGPSIRWVAVAAAIVGAIALIGALIAAGESDDGGADTAAGTEEAAELEQPAGDTDPAPTSTTNRGRSGTERTTSSSIDDEIAAADRSQSPSSTTNRSRDESSSSTSASPDGTTAGTGTGDGSTDPSTVGDGSETSTPASSTPENSTTSTPSTTATPSTTCSGVTWNPVLDEGFNGSAVDGGVWAVGSGSAGQAVQRPNAISVANGSLTITAQMLDGALVSGGLQHLSSQMYGRYEVRVRTDPDASGTMSGQVLTAGSGSSHVLYNSATQSGASSWHTVAVEWTPASVSYFVDGSLVSTTADAVPAVDHALSIRYDASATTIASNVSMQVDYVKVWEYVSGC